MRSLMISSILLITLLCCGCQDTLIYKTSAQYSVGDVVSIIPNEYEENSKYQGKGIIVGDYEYYHKRYYIVMDSKGHNKTYESDRLELVERMNWEPMEKTK